MQNKIEILCPYLLSTMVQENYKEKVDNLSLNTSPSEIIEDLDNKTSEKKICSSSYKSSYEIDNSSDSTSQTENISNSSESYPYYYSQMNRNNISFQNDFYKKENEKGNNYFNGVEKYFSKIMPEKFYDYKNSRNYIPKYSINKGNGFFIEKVEEKLQLQKKKKQNKFDKAINETQNNIFYPMMGNLYYYYSYNSFGFNYTYSNINQKEYNESKDNKIIKKEENKSEFINKVEEPKKEDDNSIYIIKKKEKKNKNIDKKNKDEKKSIKYINNLNDLNYIRNNDENRNLNKNVNNNFFRKKYNVNKNNNHFYKLNDFNLGLGQRKKNINFNKYNKFNIHNNKRKSGNYIYY